jgi:hypothetical protein
MIPIYNSLLQTNGNEVFGWLVVVVVMLKLLEEDRKKTLDVNIWL